MAAANRIKVVLLDAGTITSDGLTRVAEFASEVIVVGERRRSDVVEQLQARGVKVTVEQGKADIESAILTAARSEAVVVITGRPGKAEVFVRNAAHGAANAVEQGLPAVGVYVLGEHETGQSVHRQRDGRAVRLRTVVCRRPRRAAWPGSRRRHPTGTHSRRSHRFGTSFARRRRQRERTGPRNR